MAGNPGLTRRDLPDALAGFFASPWIASWLGIEVPSLGDIREYVLDRLDTADEQLIQIAFAGFDEDRMTGEFEDRIPVADIKPFIRTVLAHLDEMAGYHASLQEPFQIEMHFQLPFVNRSRFSRPEQARFMAPPGAAARSKDRSHLRGACLIGLAPPVLPDDWLMHRLPTVEAGLHVTIAYPPALRSYWEAVLERALGQAGKRKNKHMSA